MHSKLDEAAVQKKGGRRRGIFPSPFPDPVVIAAALRAKKDSFLSLQPL